MTDNIVFIGSSTENYDYAEAILTNLSSHNQITPVCWRPVAKQSSFILLDLQEQLRISAFGVFFLAPDDYVSIRDEEFLCVRDNVLLELGMFIGALGHQRTFIIVPKSSELKFRIPSDLAGLNYSEYNPQAFMNKDFVIASACAQIKRRIEELIDTPFSSRVVEQFGLFQSFDGLYKDLFKNANVITTAFIHSRRWRETNMEFIDNFFKRKNVTWNAILPNLTNKVLLAHLKAHFNDGETLESKILDAYIFYYNYLKSNPSKVKLFLYDLYPTYTFYKFDKTLIVSMYPLTSDRRPTPTFKLTSQTGIYNFFQQDIENILSSKTMELEAFERIITGYKEKYGI